MKIEYKPSVDRYLELMEVIVLREKAREEKDWRLADKIRDVLIGYGYTLIDEKDRVIVDLSEEAKRKKRDEKQALWHLCYYKGDFRDE